MKWGTVLVAAMLLCGCRITPEEIRLIEVENELLRQQIQVVREKCEYYQEIKVEAEESDADASPAPAD